MNSIPTNPSSLTFTSDSRVPAGRPSAAATPPDQVRPIPFPNAWNAGRYAVNSNDFRPLLLCTAVDSLFVASAKTQENHYLARWAANCHMNISAGPGHTVKSSGALTLL